MPATESTPELPHWYISGFGAHQESSYTEHDWKCLAEVTIPLDPPPQRIYAELRHLGPRA